MSPEDILHWLHGRIMDQMQAERADARATERRAIAAYLRAEANRRVEALERADRRLFVMAYASCHRWADAIERGEHLTSTQE